MWIFTFNPGYSLSLQRTRGQLLGQVLSLIIGLVALWGSTPAQAQKLYKWTDDQGKVHYTDQPPAENTAFETQNLPEASTANPETNNAARAMAEAASRHPVTLYSVPRCESCDLIRLFLNRRNIPYVDRDIKTDPDALGALQNIAEDLLLPYTAIGNVGMEGYNRDQLSQLLSNKGYPLIDTSGEPR